MYKNVFRMAREALKKGGLFSNAEKYNEAFNVVKHAAAPEHIGKDMEKE